MESLRTTVEPAGREVPHVRLGTDADLKNLYTYGRKLGQGSFGVVYEATHNETRTQWAIKEVRRPEPGSSKVKLLEQEIKILKQVNHPHIIHLKEVYETAKKIYLVTELCVGGELRHLLQRKKLFTEDEARQIIGSLAHAIVYLHKRDIVHRDLKLENILVKNSLNEDDRSRINIKVTDFGLAIKTGGVGIENMMRDACGTLTYMAPEMMSGRGYSHLCDVWSVGVIMHTLLCGEPPFLCKTKTTLLEVIMKGEVKYDGPVWSTVSRSAKELLSCLLKVDPGYRMSASQLLENPWITGDMNGPALPTNVLELMHHYLEQEENSQNQKDEWITSAADAVDKPLSSISTIATRTCQEDAEICPAKMNGLCEAAAKLESSDQNGATKIKNGSLPRTTSAQGQDGVKLCRLSTANISQPQDERVSYLSRADDLGPSPQNKTGFH
ncbi:serine/threonine-protein kinase 33 [Synchiropus splendidus]|uniref:serine/threonine-protein kinase 33 n=1 Tax=Synchiropus splendidus TaxID=270530 RepID=UPI00237D6DBB|nr:serine/threonine-protein kinase 33 [Synchiropus splendidus]